MRFSVIPMKARDYGKRVYGEPVENSAEWNRQFGSSASVADIIPCWADNRGFFRTLFGPRCFQWTGKFRFDCWLLDLGTALVIVLTAKGKGTCYEVVTHRDGLKVRKDAGRVIELMRWIANRKSQDSHLFA
jgi:hypothetical protein